MGLGDLIDHFVSQNRRLEEYILYGRYKNIIDPNQEKINTERKEKKEGYVDQGVASSIQPIKYPEDGWSSSPLRVPMLTPAELNIQISRSGKQIDSHSETHSVPTSMRKAKRFQKMNN